MFERLKHISYKQKLRLLVVGSLLFLIGCYQLAIKNTIHAYNENRNTEVAIAGSATALNNIAAYNAKLAMYNENLGSFEFNDQVNHEDAFAKITAYCGLHKIKVAAIPDLSINKHPEFDVYTSEIVVQGDFISLLKLVHWLEQKEKVGRISAIHFFKKKEKRSKKQKLNVRIYIQNIKFHHHEKEKN